MGLGRRALVALVGCQNKVRIMRQYFVLQDGIILKRSHLPAIGPINSKFALYPVNITIGPGIGPVDYLMPKILTIMWSNQTLMI